MSQFPKGLALSHCLGGPVKKTTLYQTGCSIWQWLANEVKANWKVFARATFVFWIIECPAWARLCLVGIGVDLKTSSNHDSICLDYKHTVNHIPFLACSESSIGSKFRKNFSRRVGGANLKQTLYIGHWQWSSARDFALPLRSHWLIQLLRLN